MTQPVNQENTAQGPVAEESAELPKTPDSDLIEKLENAFTVLQSSESCNSLLKKFLTRPVFDELKDRFTASGASLLDVIQSGVQNLDSSIGVYAPDASSYTVFASLFNPIISTYHSLPSSAVHPPTFFGDASAFEDLDPKNKYIKSTRIRCARSIVNYPFNPLLGSSEYDKLESTVRAALENLSGNLKGTYFPLSGMDKTTQQQLIDDHFLFKEGDRFLQAANACRFWPSGRGIFFNHAKTFLVWVNEEDHLRIISMQSGADLAAVYSRFVTAVESLEQQLLFSRDEKLGYLTFCPTNLGTAIRASVHICLPRLAADRDKLEEVAARFNLQVRGTKGEHSEGEGGVFDISNKRRLGLTEYEVIKELQDGILEMIRIEENES